MIKNNTYLGFAKDDITIAVGRLVDRGVCKDEKDLRQRLSQRKSMDIR